MRVVSNASDSLCVFVYEKVRRRGLGGSLMMRIKGLLNCKAWKLC